MTVKVLSRFFPGSGLPYNALGPQRWFLMMNLRCFAFVALTTLSAAAEPTFDWVFAGGGVKNDKCRSVTTDREGNVFMACETTDDGVFGSVQRKGLGGMDFCLVKLDPHGKALWVRSIGGSLVDRGYGVATDAKGNAYVTGHYQSQDAVADHVRLANNGDYDIFVAKYDRDGTLAWMRTAGGKGYDYGHGIAVDDQNHVIVAGGIGSDATFGENATVQGHAVFCAKYDSEGRLLWVRGTSGKAGGSAHGVAVDAAGHIYVGGLVSGEGEFGKAKVSTKTQAVLVAKLSPAGEVEWATITPGTPSALAHEITADREGRVWIAGMFKGSVTFGSETFTSTGEKDSDGFLAHYSTRGELQWARQLRGPQTDYCLGVATDGEGTSYVTGEFSESATLGGRTLTTMGATDIYTAAFDARGTMQWLVQSGGAKGDNAYTMAYHNGHLIFSGACAAPATFGNVKLEQSGGADAYAAQMKVK